MSWAIWITGRPGSGKSTLARQVAAALERRGERVAILEASAFAAETVPGRPPSAHEWDIVHRALIRAATEMTRAGVPVIIDGTAPRRAWRELARSAIPRFALDYEYSLRADLTVNTESQPVWSAAEGVLLLIERLHASTAPDARKPGGTQGTAGPSSA